jgi:hypothetical protein
MQVPLLDLKALLFVRLTIQTLTTYRKSGRLFILRDMESRLAAR